MDLHIRDLQPDEFPFLREMLYTAALWRPDDPRPEPQWVMEQPQIAPFHEEWGRPGDTALVAEDDGRLIGAIWYRFFTEERHGHGFIDEKTPEIAIAVVQDARGRGVGRALMQALHDRARRDGVVRLALSVNADNPAKRLYTSFGYIEYAPDDPYERMTLTLQ
jgi:GNAT superfamily N-acetyltransferase